jgi:hypothetical protein
MVHYAMHAGFTFFGTIHVAILCAVPVLAGALSFAHRRFPAARNFVRLGFAAILLMDTAVYYGWQITHHSLTFPHHMPFELCDASMALTVLSLFLLRPLAEGRCPGGDQATEQSAAAAIRHSGAWGRGEAVVQRPR